MADGLDDDTIRLCHEVTGRTPDELERLLLFEIRVHPPPQLVENLTQANLETGRIDPLGEDVAYRRKLREQEMKKRFGW